MKSIYVAAAIIEKDEKILIAQRLKGDWAGYWEFPGGKVEAGETSVETIKREIMEEFGVEINAGPCLCTVEHNYPTFHLIMDCFLCTLSQQDLQLRDHSAVRWIDPFEPVTNWVGADVKVIENYCYYLQEKKK